MAAGIRSLLPCPPLAFLAAAFLLAGQLFILPAGEVQVRVLHTSDLHGALQARPEEGEPGLLRVATRLRQAHADSPEGHALLLDTGDTLQGSLASWLGGGKPMLAWLDALPYDTWTPGNHDFDFGYDVFREAAQRLGEKILCGNLHPRKGAEERDYPSWRLFTFGAAKVAVIGATASYMPNWFLDFPRHFRVESLRAMLRRVMPEVLASEPHAIILAVHQGWMEQDARGVNELKGLPREFPEIDLVLGGHTHRAFPGRSIGVNTWYEQPASGGKYFGQIDLWIDPGERRVTRLESRLVETPAETPEDPETKAALSPWLSQAEALSREVIAPALPKALSAKGRPGVDCAASALLCQALSEATGAELALHGVLSREEIPGGVPLTRRELHALVPYENTIVVCQVTAGELGKILEEQWALRKHSSYSGLQGVEAIMDREGHCQILSIAGQPPIPNKRYTLALNSHEAAGSGRTPVLRQILDSPGSQTRDTGISTRQAALQWFQKHPGELPGIRAWLQTPGGSRKKATNP